MTTNKYEIFCEDVTTYLENRSRRKKKFDLVVTSPPYNIGKEYEENMSTKDYISFHKKIIDLIMPHMSKTGSICWQVGNYVNSKDKSIMPLEYLFHDIFKEYDLKMRNRIIWTYNSGLHRTKSFSGRHEVIMWYTMSDDYNFNLDAVRIPQLYPNKKAYRGPNKGKKSGNKLGKNPGDFWDNITNVKHNHIEYENHPCQFPVGLVERLVLSITNKNDLIFDPFMGTGSSGVASLIHGRKFEGTEIMKSYYEISDRRLKNASIGNFRYRPHDTEIYRPKN